MTFGDRAEGVEYLQVLENRLLDPLVLDLDDNALPIDQARRVNLSN